METRYFDVAGHVFAVSGEEVVFSQMLNYERFECIPAATAGSEPDTVFRLSIGESASSDYMEASLRASLVEELRQVDDGQEIVCGRSAAGESVFEFIWEGKIAGWLICSPDYRKGRLVTMSRHTKMAIDNALMVMYALATAERNTVLFHAAVVSHEGRGYMFLGPSGTGKSTHARLWLKHIEGTALVNDDNPVVRISDDGSAVVYGSPWSGKTPCYRNVSYPLGGIVILSQAPHNKIRRLRGIEAYALLVPSISGKRWDTKVADGLHQTENSLAGNVPMWYLECLPDEEAARVCEGSIRN